MYTWTEEFMTLGSGTEVMNHNMSESKNVMYVSVAQQWVLPPIFPIQQRAMHQAKYHLTSCKIRNSNVIVRAVAKNIAHHKRQLAVDEEKKSNRFGNLEWHPS